MILESVRLKRLSGVFLLLLPLVVLLGVLLTLAAGADADVFDRDQADDLLESIRDNAGLVAVGLLGTELWVVVLGTWVLRQPTTASGSR